MATFLRLESESNDYLVNVEKIILVEAADLARSHLILESGADIVVDGSVQLVIDQIKKAGSNAFG